MVGKENKTSIKIYSLLMVGKIEDFLNDNFKKVLYSLAVSPFLLAILVWSVRAIEASQWGF